MAAERGEWVTHTLQELQQGIKDMETSRYFDNEDQETLRKGMEAILADYTADYQSRETNRDRIADIVRRIRGLSDVISARQELLLRLTRKIDFKNPIIQDNVGEQLSERQLRLIKARRELMAQYKQLTGTAYYADFPREAPPDARPRTQPAAVTSSRQPSPPKRQSPMGIPAAFHRRDPPLQDCQPAQPTAQDKEKTPEDSTDLSMLARVSDAEPVISAARPPPLEPPNLQRERTTTHPASTSPQTHRRPLPSSPRSSLLDEFLPPDDATALSRTAESILEALGVQEHEPALGRPDVTADGGRGAAADSDVSDSDQPPPLLPPAGPAAHTS